MHEANGKEVGLAESIFRRLLSKNYARLSYDYTDRDVVW